MQIYLPIAEMSVSIWLILAMGGAVGFVTGMFGVGGGFLMTPFLIFIGVPPAVAVASTANQVIAGGVTSAYAHWRRRTVAVATGASQIVASSVSGVAAHAGRRSVDFKMGVVLVAGGVPGTVLGVWIVSLLKESGQIDLVIKLAYVGLLGSIGLLMLSESVRTLMRTRKVAPAKAKATQHYWVHGLPLKLRFRVSKLYISALPPLGLGFLSGFLSGIMGIGGGFIMVPAMIYILRMPASAVIGTSLFQVLCISALTTFLHAWINQTVDIVLALILMVGGVVGVQYGGRVGARIRSDYLRLMISLLIVGMALRLSGELIAPPSDLYSIAPGEETRGNASSFFARWLSARRPPPRMKAAARKRWLSG